MKTLFQLSTIAIILLLTACNSSEKQTQANIKMYSQVWDEIINKQEIDKINDTYFDSDITHVSNPENIVGIEDFKAYSQTL